jgi:hypothetical protein
MVVFLHSRSSVLCLFLCVWTEVRCFSEVMPRGNVVMIRYDNIKTVVGGTALYEV